MMIIDAIRAAETKPVVYSLLTAYLQAVDSLDARCGLPVPVKRLPISRGQDVRNRARLLHGTLKARDDTAGERAMIGEAAEVFNAAWARLRVLERPFKASGSQDSTLWRRLHHRTGMRPHLPLAFGWVALAVVCSLWARNSARAVA
jgi:hypothetical protein